MPTANEELADALIRHQIYLLRYSSTVRNRIISLLNASEEDVARRIRDKLRNSSGLQSPSEWKRLQDLMEVITRVRSESWAEATENLVGEMTLLAVSEPNNLDSLVRVVMPVQFQTVIPDARQLRAIALSRPFQGRVLKEWAETMKADDIRRIHAAVQAGMVAGEDSATIARRVIGTARLNGIDGITEISRRQVQAITRTAVQHIANTARDMWHAENIDIIHSERFVATLDSRTTPVCRAFDGKSYPVGKGPRPPLHMACRSLRVATIDGNVAGERPAKPTTERILVGEYAAANGLTGEYKNRDSLPRGTKGDFDQWARKRIRQLVGPVPAQTTYQTWLKRQSVAFQNDVLGVTKARLFRAGNLPLDKFVDSNGSELSLKQLAQKHKDAFLAAGLDPSLY